eukprot:g4088.t1
MYVGSVNTLPQELLWVLDDTSLPNQPHFIEKSINFNPGLYKIFDEILVNAVDNVQRDKSTNRIEVSFLGTDTNSPVIEIKNNGKGVPVRMHKQEGIYVPELVFGYLLTGSNFTDKASKFTGGRHGYGAKLTNIFSRCFQIDTADTQRGVRYRQKWTKNMQHCEKPVIETIDSGSTDYTKVIFEPDLSRFGETYLSEGMLQLMKKRVWDIAGCTPGISVMLNGAIVGTYNETKNVYQPFQSFGSYVSLYHRNWFEEDVGDCTPHPLVDVKLNRDWEIAVASSPSSSFSHVSFVNKMASLRGGTHVSAIADLICRPIADISNKREPDLKLTPAAVRQHLHLFVNANVANPSFDSQTKEMLTTSVSDLGVPTTLPKKALNAIVEKSGIVEATIAAAKSRQKASLYKKTKATKSRMLAIPKLSDANLAGTSKSASCTLILTEGDSAKALAMSGVSVVGRETYGVYPLKGKLLNVRDSSIRVLSQSDEIQQLVSAIGLDFRATYDNTSELKKLRYGRVMIMADQDHDGSHIKGLLLNLFHHFWPELLKRNEISDNNSFLQQFVTPIIKVFLGRESGRKELAFYSMSDYAAWRKQMSPEQMAKCTVKYYKGLGTSTAAEGKEYFKAIDTHRIDFVWSGEEDANAIDLAFKKSRAAERKAWLQDTPISLDGNMNENVKKRTITYSDFVNTDLIQFSHADVLRSIPSIVDGLKPSQRKVLYACFKRRLRGEIKVAQLAGYVSEHAGYHHGEASLHATIINMAQDYVGSNNLPLLVPAGQFGTRLLGGKDHASARYIYSSLSEVSRLLFPAVDDLTLNRVEEDGVLVEPVWYAPIIPMCLVNGAKGIGTGWSTSVPPHHPIEIIDEIRRCLRKKMKSEKNDFLSFKIRDLVPWIRGFKGAIETSGKSFRSVGVLEQLDGRTIQITELPFHRWTQPYKEFLVGLVQSGKIKSFEENHTESQVHFTIHFRSRAGLIDAIDRSGNFENFFKLKSNLLLTNMHLLDRNGRVQRYTSSGEIMKAFLPERLKKYGERKILLERSISTELRRLDDRCRFLQLVCDGFDITKRNRDEIEKDLTKLGFTPYPYTAKDDDVDGDVSAAAAENATSEVEDSINVDEAGLEAYNMHRELSVSVSKETMKKKGKKSRGVPFDYLLRTPLSSLTTEKVRSLQEQRDKMAKNLETLRLETPESLWLHDLEKLRDYLLRSKDFSPRN